jgi:hypothetical protein
MHTTEIESEKTPATFEGNGLLCFVVKRPLAGIGEPVLIIHEAVQDKEGIVGYGAFRTWTVAPDTLKQLPAPVAGEVPVLVES